MIDTIITKYKIKLQHDPLTSKYITVASHLNKEKVIPVLEINKLVIIITKFKLIKVYHEI